MNLGAKMTELFKQLLREEDGQDLIEYTLLITFIAIASMWLLGAGQPAVNQIWTTANSHMTVANTLAAS
jgi:Flp pilus assembly pilin Flp